MLAKCKGEMDILGKFHVRLIEPLPEYGVWLLLKAVQTVFLTADNITKLYCYLCFGKAVRASGGW